MICDLVLCFLFWFLLMKLIRYIRRSNMAILVCLAVGFSNKLRVMLDLLQVTFYPSILLAIPTKNSVFINSTQCIPIVLVRKQFLKIFAQFLLIPHITIEYTFLVTMIQSKLFLFLFHTTAKNKFQDQRGKQANQNLTLFV